MSRYARRKFELGEYEDVVAEGFKYYMLDRKSFGPASDCLFAALTQHGALE